MEGTTTGGARDAGGSDRRSDEEREEGLQRVIGFWSALALVVGLIIGSGIFRAPASVARHLPDAPSMMLAWLIGGLLSIAGGLSAAELGVRYPRSGGQYVFLREAFGSSVAFAFGVTQVLISKPSILAGIATVFAVYFSGLVEAPADTHKALAVGAILLLTAINCLGVKSGTRTQNVLTFLKTAGLALLGVAALTSGRGEWSRFGWGAPHPALSGAAGGPDGAAGAGAAGIAAADSHPWLIALALGLVTILYTYDGWIDVTYTAGEVVHPERTLPRAIILGTLICTGLYLAANAAYIYLLGPAELPLHQNVAAVAIERAFGAMGGRTLGALVIVSTLGILNGSILTGVRVPYAMGRDGVLPRFLGRVHLRTHSPVSALLVQGMFASFVVLYASGFDEIASLFVTTTWFFYAVSFVGLLWIQWREREDDGGRSAGERASERGDGEGRSAGEGAARRAFRMPLSPWPAVLFIVVTLFIVGSDLAYGGWKPLLGMAIVFAAVPLHLLGRFLNLRLASR